MCYSITQTRINYDIEEQFFFFSFFFSNEDNPILVYKYHTFTVCKNRTYEKKIRSSDYQNPNVAFFLFNLNLTTNCFLTNTYRTSIDSFRMVISLKFHYQGANGYFVRHDLISSYSPYPSWSETVYWNNQAKQIAFFGWNWSWIARLSPISR